MTTGRINQVCNDHSNPTCQPGKAWTDHLWTVVFSTNTLAMRVMFKELFASPQQPTSLMNYIAMCKSTFKAKPPFRPCLQAPIKRSTRHYIYALTLPQTHPVIKQCNNIQPAKQHSQCTFLRYDYHPSFNLHLYIDLDAQQLFLSMFTFNVKPHFVIKTMCDMHNAHNLWSHNNHF